MQHSNVWRRPRIRTVLLIVNLVILLLPLIGTKVLNLYESELIQREEATLLAQGAYIREYFKMELLEELRRSGTETGTGFFFYGLPVPASYLNSEDPAQERYHPYPTTLTMSDNIRPPAEAAIATSRQPDAAASAAGKAVERVIARAQRYTLSGIRVVDYQGIVVATTHSELHRSLIQREEVQHALRGEVYDILRQRVADELETPQENLAWRNRVRIFVALPVVHRDRILGAVILSRTPMDISKALYNFRFALLRFAVILVLIVIFVSFLTSITISRPLQALVRQTEKVKAGDPAAAKPLGNPGSHEIAVLSESIATMAETLHARAEYIEAFAKNVSHEFKTPLASIQGTVELFRDHLETMSAGEKDRFLNILASDASRMEKLVGRLLTLAKADVTGPSTETTTPYETLKAIVRRYNGRDLHVRCELAPETQTATIKMAPEIFESIISNLLENSRQHGGVGVEVTLQLSWHNLAENKLEVGLDDNGPGISEGNLKKIFTPFFTTARDRGGTGLGLAIVRSLLKTHGGDIVITSPSHQAAKVAGKRGVSIRLVIPT